MNEKIITINRNLEPYKEDIVNHKLYNKLKNTNDIAVLMENHV